MSEPLIIKRRYMTAILDVGCVPPTNCVEYHTYDVQNAVTQYMQMYHRKPVIVYQDHEADIVYIPLGGA